MKIRDYDTMYDETTGNTETHVATDEMMRRRIELGSTEGERNAFNEGFASASGIRPDTAATGGRIKHPETRDASENDPVPKSIEKSNSGLAE